MSQPRKVIVFANRKGGVGKTKSSVFLSEVLRRAGHAVTGIDLDPERGWIKYQVAGFLAYPVLAADAKSVKATAAELTGFVVIDTPPNDPESMMKAALLADEVFVPLAATGDDISRLDSTLADITEIEEARRVPLTTVFYTRFDPRKIISREAVSLMQERGIPVADQKIHQRTELERFGPPRLLDDYIGLALEIGLITEPEAEAARA